jgi:hypothetical protein
MDRFPTNVYKTGMGWDSAQSGYKVQIGNYEQTIAYAWVPLGKRREEDVIADAVEIANRMIEGWRDHPRHQVAK